MFFLPSLCLLNKGIIAEENLNRLGHDVGMNGRERVGMF